MRLSPKLSILIFEPCYSTSIQQPTDSCPILNTIRSRVMDLFTEGKWRISLMLQSALSSIHITFDAWITPKHLGAWGIVGHFTSEDGSLHDLLLSLTEHEGSHSGYNQAQLFLKTLTSYSIRNRLGHFVIFFFLKILFNVYIQPFSYDRPKGTLLWIIRLPTMS